MATVAENSFEIERRNIMFKPTTSLPNGSSLGYDGDPNNAVNGNTDGETLLYNSPMATMYSESDGTIWVKNSTPNTWTEVQFGGSGAVNSVNGETGTVILTTSDITEDTDYNYVTDAEKTAVGNLSGVNTGDVTVSDSSEIDLSIIGQQLTASIKNGSIDETKLDSSVNASLDLADSAVQTETDPVFIASEAYNITGSDITNLSNLSGVNTGDQDLSSYALKNNVLELDNTTVFTPDADYEPATKKYVDDNAGGSGDMTKAVYDTDDDGVVDNSEQLQGEDGAYYLSRTNHTGTQTASTISDFDTEVANNSDVTLNTTHRSSDGSDHGFIDQDVTNGSSPIFTGTNFTAIPTSGVEICTLNITPHKTVQDYLNTVQASGYYTGGDFTDNGDGTATVAAGVGAIRATDSFGAQIEAFQWSTDTSVSLVDDTTNYVYARYNSGSPDIASSTTHPSDSRTNVLLGKIFRSGNTLHLFKAGMYIPELAKNVLVRFIEGFGEITRVSGAVIGETGTRNLSSTTGVVWGGLTRTTTSSQDTSGADDFTYFYYDGASWIEASETQINNTQYNNVASGLSTLTTNQYGVHWVYVDADGHLLVVYGQDSYKLLAAEAAQPPSDLPSRISQFAFLAAKILIKKNDSSFTEIQSAYDIAFNSSVTTIHNELAGLQGGAADEYYHASSAEYTVLQNTSGTNTGDITVTDSAEIDFTLTNQDLTASIKNGSIDETKLDSSVNTSLDLADSAVQTETDPVFVASQAHNITSTDITNLSNLSGTNTGDQDLSGYALKTNVLELDNTGAFTPNADYEPATKKYVDDNAGGSSITINTEDLSAPKTLTVGTDDTVQYLNPNGANRTVTLSTTNASEGDSFTITNNDTYDSAYYLTIILNTTTAGNLYSRATVKYFYDGSSWLTANQESFNGTNTDTNLSIGAGANGTSIGVALGYHTNGNDYGVAVGAYTSANSRGAAVGYYSQAQTYGVALGCTAYGANYGVALGYDTDTNDKYYSTAIGYFSKCERYDELTHAIDHATTNQNNWGVLGLMGSTSSASQTEIFLAGVSPQRIILINNSVMNFKIMVTAADITTGDVAGYNFEGLIKNVGGTTALVGSLQKTTLSEDDSSWDCTVEADDANDALIIKVTGDSANTVKWTARVDIVETRY